MTRPEETNLPVWLRGVPLPEPPPDSVPALPREDSAGLPNWLRDLGSAQQSGLPAGSAPAEEPLPAEDRPQEDEGDLPDWLQSLGEPAPMVAPANPSAPVIEEPRIPPPRTPGFTNWLTGEPSPPPAPTSAASASKEDLPAWLRGEAAASQSPESEELPDWISSLEPKPSVSPADPTVSAPPSWLGSDVTPAVVPEDTSPAWLSVTGPVAPTGPSVPADDQDVPGWLRDIPETDIGQVSHEDTDLGMTPFSIGDVPPVGTASEWLGANASQLINPTPVPEPASPAWLDASKTIPPADNSQSDLDDLGSDIPNWLREAAGPIPEDAPASAWADDAPRSGMLAGSDDDDDVPAWLRDVSPTPAPAPPPAEQGPSWLSSNTPAPVAPEPAEDVPAWLSSNVPEPAPAEDVPSWLRDNVAEASEPVAPTPPPVADQDVPAWLRADQPAQPATPPSMPSAVDNDLPAWMRDASTPAELEPPVAPTTPGDLPDWLQNTTSLPSTSDSDALPPWLRDEVGEPLPTTIAPGDAGLPAWLRGTDFDAPAPALQQPSAPSAAEITQSSATSDSDLLGGADLPAWLRRDTEKPRDTNPADARSLDWLAQLGSVDDDIAPVAVEAGPRLRLPTPPARTTAQIEALNLLRSMAANPLPSAAPPLVAAPKNALSRIGLERLLSIVLLLVLLAGLATPGLANGLTAPPATPLVSTFHDQISALGPEDVVLIGYEWDAQRISEMRALERAVVGQLIAQHVRVVLVSTDPQGALLQFDLRDELTTAGYKGRAEDYVLLGYRAGGEIGLRQLAQDLRGALRSDFQGSDATNGPLATIPDTGEARLSTLNDFAMVLVLADEPTDVQGWMEQIRPATTRPMGFLVPASVGPFAQPYFRLPGVVSLIGTQDALAYEQLRGGDASGQTALQASQLRLVSLIFAGLLALSTVGVLLRELVLRRRRTA